MTKDTVNELRKISTPKQFEKDEYICHEGQPGEEMYIILKGAIGVYLTSAIGTLTEVARLEQGDFFGEMALFDHLPRSASCIALEDSVCVAINKSNLSGFLANCPDMTEKILENLSARIRKLNNDLYKLPNKNRERSIATFAIPVEYGFSHVVKEPYQDPKVVTQYAQRCPVCGQTIRVVDLKRNIMKVKKMDPDCRIEYFMCEPLWYDVISCPHCYYTNHHLSFFKINPMDRERTRKLLKEQHAPVVERKEVKRTPFDVLIMQYFQAIHINEYLNADDNAMLGTLWLNLYWLGKDSGDDKFTNYCAENALEKLQAAMESGEITEKVSAGSIALSLANLLLLKGQKKEASHYCALALNCPDERVAEQALGLRAKFTE